MLVADACARVCGAVASRSVTELLTDLDALIKRNVTMKLLPLVQIFSSLSSAEIEVLVDSSTDASFKPGDTVIRQGEAKSYVYVIKQGTAKSKVVSGACAACAACAAMQ